MYVANKSKKYSHVIHAQISTCFASHISMQIRSNYREFGKRNGNATNVDYRTGASPQKFNRRLYLGSALHGGIFLHLFVAEKQIKRNK